MSPQIYLFTEMCVSYSEPLLLPAMVHVVTRLPGSAFQAAWVFISAALRVKNLRWKLKSTYQILMNRKLEWKNWEKRKYKLAFLYIHLQISLENIIYSSTEYLDCLVFHKMLIPFVGFPTIVRINCQLITVMKYNFKHWVDKNLFGFWKFSVTLLSHVPVVSFIYLFYIHRGMAKSLCILIVNSFYIFFQKNSE